MTERVAVELWANVCTTTAPKEKKYDVVQTLLKLHSTDMIFARAYTVTCESHSKQSMHEDKNVLTK